MINVHPIIKEILNNRGICEEFEIEEYLSQRPTKTYNPFLLHHMKEGVDLIMESINSNKRICIYGDYDVDGITSISILMLMLSNLTDNVWYYVPSRFKEGYGLNQEALKLIREEGTDLVITVDCGSVSYNEVEYAKEIGLDIIVTDHHTIDAVQADCILINPKKDECNYSNKNLAGCTVAYKLACAIQQRGNLDKSTIARLLDITAIGTIGDIVPLTDENRTIVKYGIYEINKSSNIGLNKLIERTGLKKGSITSENIAYIIVPHLNAAGRMAKANHAVDLLLAKEEAVAEELVNKLIELNKERKKAQDETFEICLALMEEQCRNSLFPIIKAEEAHEGITGIVAGKIKDKIGRPVAILTPSKGALKGTGRSIENINLYHVIKAHENLLIKFGGHKGACGFSISEENLNLLREGVEKELKNLYSANKELFNNEVVTDMIIEKEQVSFELAETVDTMAPFGNSNEKPIFEIKQVLIEKVFLMGVKKNHIKFSTTLANKVKADCIMFGRAEEYKGRIIENERVDVIGTLSINHWNGRKSLQLLVEDIR